MGKVIERIKVTNIFDTSRTQELNALVDTGATMLVLPAEIIQELGLREVREVTVRYADNSRRTKSIFGVLRVELQGRFGHFDVLQEERGGQALVGQIVLEELDLVVDPKGRGLVPNPESPDMPLLDIM